jgi:hypothetical protein
MASWFNLTATYVSAQRIDVATWNSLAGYSGNLQYLKDTLDTYTTQQYYTIGFRTSWSFIDVASPIPVSPEYFSIDTDSYIDEKPDDVDNQFFDEDDLSAIKIRNTGMYLLTAYYNSIVDWDSSLGKTQKQEFYFTDNDTDKIISKTKFAGSVTGSLSSWIEASPNPVHNFYMGILNENTVISPRIYINDTTGGNKTIATFTGSNTSFIDNQSTIVAKSPYVATLFLKTTNPDAIPPTLVFSINGNHQLSKNTSITTQYYQQTNNSSTDGYENALFTNYFNTEMIGYPPTSTSERTTKYLINSWMGTIDTKYNLGFTYPTSVPGISSKSVLTHFDNNTDYIVNPYYFLFSFKSFNIYNNIPINTEQNILSIEQIESRYFPGYIAAADVNFEQYIGTPLQLTVFHDGTNIKLILRMYTNVTIVSFSNVSVSDRMLFGFRAAQTINQSDIYWPTLYINNTEIASISSWAPNLTTYTLDNTDTSIWNRITFGGVDYYPVKGSISNNANYSAFYFIGNYKLSDTSIDSGDYVEKEKRYLWNNIPSMLSFTAPNYTYVVTTETAGIILNSWTFGTLIGFA